MSQHIDPTTGKISLLSLFGDKNRQKQIADMQAFEQTARQFQILQGLGGIGKAARDTGDPSVMDAVGQKISDIFGSQAMSNAPESPGTSVNNLRGNIAGGNARSAAGLGQDQIAKSVDVVSGLQQGLTELGVPAGVAGAVNLGNANRVSTKAAEQAVTRQTQTENNRASLFRQREKQRSQKDLARFRVNNRAPTSAKEDPRAKLVFDLTKRLLPKPTVDEPVTTTNELTGQSSTKIVKKDRPITAKDLRKATRIAQKTVDQIFANATPGAPGTMSPSNFQARHKTRARAGEMASRGVPTGDATLAAVSEQAGPHAAFQLPPQQLDADGHVADPETLAADMADRLVKVIKFRDMGIGGIKETLPDDASLQQFVVDLLVAAGVPDADVPQILPLIAGELKKQGM